MNDREKALLEKLELFRNAGLNLSRCANAKSRAEKKWADAIVAAAHRTSQKEAWNALMDTEEGQELYELCRIADLDKLRAGIEYDMIYSVIRAQTHITEFDEEYENEIKRIIEGIGQR